jgi:hypothetical protein
MAGAMTMREAFAMGNSSGASVAPATGVALMDSNEPAAPVPDVEVARLPRPRPEGY